MSGDGPPEIEFLTDEPDAGPGEELLSAGDPRPRRWWASLAVVAVVIAGGLLAARAATQHSRSATPASTTPSPTAPIGGFGTGAPDSGSGLLNGPATTETLVPVGGPPPLPLPHRRAGDPAACPVAHSCYHMDGVDAAVRASIMDAFPRARIDGGRTVRFTDQPSTNVVWYRQVRARVGAERLLVQVEAPGPGAANRVVLGERSLTYERKLFRYDVRVRLAGRPTGTHPPLAALARLAGDLRLLTPA